MILDLRTTYCITCTAKHLWPKLKEIKAIQPTANWLDLFTLNEESRVDSIYMFTAALECYQTMVGFRCRSALMDSVHRNALTRIFMLLPCSGNNNNERNHNNRQTTDFSSRPDPEISFSAAALAANAGVRLPNSFGGC